MEGFRSQFTSIKGVSERRRLPRLGKIRLGIKVISKKTGRSYPKETDYFVCPPEVQKVYGDRPKELDVMFPINDREIIFPQAYCWYGKSRGIKCMGDGERAMRAGENGFEPRECPCEKLEKKECGKRAHLMTILYKVSLGGIYQIDLGSYHSIVDINSGLDYATALIGRFAMVPFKLRRVPRETHANGSKQIHYTLVLTPDVDINMLNELRQDTRRVLAGPQYILPAPENINPEYDNGAVEVVEDAAEAEETGEEQGAQTSQEGADQEGGAKEKLTSELMRLWASLSPGLNEFLRESSLVQFAREKLKCNESALEDFDAHDLSRLLRAMREKPDVPVQWLQAWLSQEQTTETEPQEFAEEPESELLDSGKPQDRSEEQPGIMSLEEVLNKWQKLSKTTGFESEVSLMQFAERIIDSAATRIEDFNSEDLRKLLGFLEAHPDVVEKWMRLYWSKIREKPMSTSRHRFLEKLIHDAEVDREEFKRHLSDFKLLFEDEKGEIHLTNLRGWAADWIINNFDDLLSAMKETEVCHA